MWKAIKRFFKSIARAFSGRVDEASDSIASSPHAVRATFTDIIDKKMADARRYSKAVGGLIAHQERKIERVKTLTGEIEKLERIKKGAAAKARQRNEALKAEGKSAEEIKTDEEYLKCRAGFKNATKRLMEKQAEIEELEAGIEGDAEQIKKHKLQLTELKREIEKIKGEAEATVADMIASKQEKEVNEAFAGIGVDDSANSELERMRNLRRQAKAEARVSSELAGTDARLEESEFLEFAAQTESDSEFDALVGLDEPDDIDAEFERLQQVEDSAVAEGDGGGSLPE